MKPIIRVVLLVGAVYFAIMTESCKEQGCTDPMAQNYEPDAELNDGSCAYEDVTNVLKTEFSENYAAMALATYEDALDEAILLQVAIEDFVQNPTIPGLENCKSLWLQSRIPYNQCEAFDFYGSPGEQLKSRLNEWVFDPNRIDKHGEGVPSGIINETDVYPIINAETLKKLHDEGTTALGYHVLEFLLWGNTATGGGGRKFNEFLASDTTVANTARRAAYLKVCADQLVLDLAAVANAWRAGFKTEFMNYSPRKRTRLAMAGLVKFAQLELAETRIGISVDQSLPNREESTFSNNTSNDVKFNALGLRNVFNGSYGRIDSTYVEGTSLLGLFNAYDADKATLAMEAMTNLVTSSSAIESPYQAAMQAEQNGPAGPIANTRQFLNEFSDVVREMATEMGMGLEGDLMP